MTKKYEHKIVFSQCPENNVYEENKANIWQIYFKAFLIQQQSPETVPIPFLL